MLKRMYRYLLNLLVGYQQLVESNTHEEGQNVATKKTAGKKKKKVGKARSAVTGKYVTPKFADENKATTVKERK
jgi:hypothetical protein